MSFNEMVAEWLRAQGHAVKRVESVTGNGTDWYGDTENGFDSMFNTWVVWVDIDGGRHSDEVEGSDMESLWKHIVGAWPAQTDVDQARGETEDK